jgi:hypothetical protein
VILGDLVGLVAEPATPGAQTDHRPGQITRMQIPAGKIGYAGLSTSTGMPSDQAG